MTQPSPIMPTLDALKRITVYPIKSLDGIELTEAAITPGGALEHDREFALLDGQGRVLRAKGTPLLHQIRACYDLSQRSVSLRAPKSEVSQAFHLDDDRGGLETWFSNVLEQPVQLLHEPRAGVPDDANLMGPTVVATPTVELIASWFDGVSTDEMATRLRANLLIDADLPFAEETLLAEQNQAVRFEIGTVQAFGVSPCARCEVPSRDATTGKQDASFAKTFCAGREQTLPHWSQSQQFAHMYFATVRTRIDPSQSGKRMRVGDPCRVLGAEKVNIERPFTRLADRIASIVSAQAK